MLRRLLPPLVILLALVPLSARQTATAGPSPLTEVTVAQLQEGMASGTYTARGLVDLYLARIESLDKSGPALGAVIEINPQAREIADALDAERKVKGPRGPLHGIPILIKDNID